MKKIEYAVHVNLEKCKGDRLCADICPAGAITMKDNKAVSDPRRCVACFKCIDICPHEAVTSYEREEPRIAFVNPVEVDQDALRSLCLKAELDPSGRVCACGSTTSEEIAAAILKGAKTPEDISSMTGARSGCLIYCTAAIMRLLKAHYPDFEVERPPKFYNATLTSMDVPEVLDEKYPIFGIKQEQLARKRLIEG